MAGLPTSALYRIAYGNRRLIALSVYATIAVVAYTLAFLLRFEFTWSASLRTLFIETVPFLLAIRLAGAAIFKISRGRWRFVGPRDVLRLVLEVTTGSVAFYLVSRPLALIPAVPRSIIAIEWVLSIYFTAGLWIVYRVAFEQLRHLRFSSNGDTRRVLVVGAGEAGNMLVREMARFPTGYRPVGFVDDDPAKWGMRLQGIRVIGSTADLGPIARACGAHEVLVATPGAPPEQLRRIVGGCEASGLRFKVLPGIAEVMKGNVRLNQVREVRIEDLLGRDPIQLELPALSSDLRGRSVIITGAAGSIGSELARQVGLHSPATLVLLDQAETQLYYLELELRRTCPDVHIVPVVGDVVDAACVEHVFATHRPMRVFHAAAYKHVPMMESNVRVAVRNNVIGTWRVAEAAGRHGAEKCVLVSTDKAVRPTSVMGATKRLAELSILELQSRYARTRFTAVRFGNVLGSNGSVIPIFREQIQADVPLTVTHPDATRYFMTIPEAVQLILQSSMLPEVRGRIAMLEMGEPVRILDLARNLLRLSGANGRDGQRIVFTGLRPGEKLHEELVAPDEQTTATAINKVRLIAASPGNGRSILPILPELERLVSLGAADTLCTFLVNFFPTLLGDARPIAAPVTRAETTELATSTAPLISSAPVE